MQIVCALLLFVIGGAIGMRAPDFDQVLRWSPVLMHRSLLTHSFFFPLLLCLNLVAPKVARTLGLVSQQERQEFARDAPARWFIMGISLAIAVHLCFDLFPRSWGGYARIHVPLYGWTTPLLSQLWLLASAFVCLRIACTLMRRIEEFFLSFFGIVVAFAVAASAQPHLAFFAVIPLTVLGFIAFVLPGGSRPRFARKGTAVITDWQ
ncbi:MAG: hypothetical protein H7Z41_06285 [Cytophagales bacterium]|nr:hypothetical protein [Armatimonadota bacterium]